MYYFPPRDSRITRGLEDFGVALVQARARIGMSQRRLEMPSGVSQSVISRAERALTPRLALERVVGIKLVLGVEFPLGWCPHDHLCRWQPRAKRAEQLQAYSEHLAMLLRSRIKGDCGAFPADRDPAAGRHPGAGRQPPARSH